MVHKEIQTDSANSIIYAGIAGTAYMTLFSYLASTHKNKNFKEPELLGILLHRRPVNINYKAAQLTGWLLHYAIGVLFAGFYKPLINKRIIKNNAVAGAITGAVSGIIAVGVWHTLLRLHPHTPNISRSKFYKHLVLTHIVFGIATFKYLKKHTKNYRHHVIPINEWSTLPLHKI